MKLVLTRVLLLVILTMPFGCGGTTDGVNRLGVSGKVVFNNQDVPKGEIQFVPLLDTGKTAPAATIVIVKGLYRSDHSNGPVAGKHRVVISGKTGEPHENDPDGVSLFPAYTTEIVIEPGKTYDFEVPNTGGSSSPKK